MHFTDLLALARDNLSRARLRSSLTAIGVTIGTAAVVLLISVGNGAEAITVNRIAQFGSLTMIQVMPSTASTGRQLVRQHSLTPATLRAIRALPHVTSVDTSLQTPPLRLTINGRSIDVSATGQTPLASGITLVAGSQTASAPTDGVIVPASAARALHVSASALVGHQVTLTAGGDVAAPTRNDSAAAIFVAGPDRRFTANVTGVYDDSSTGNAILLVSSPLAAAIDGQLSGTSGPAYLNLRGYTSLVAHVDDSRQTTAVATRIGTLGYAVRDEAAQLAEIHTAYTILKALLATVGGIALLVAAVGIANTLIMTILERTREIGIMKALGAEPSTMRRLFLVETGLIGLIGGLAGLALASLAGVAGNAIFKAWLSSQSAGDVPATLFLIPPILAGGAVLFAVVMSLAAGFFPSQRAVRLQPLEALRYE